MIHLAFRGVLEIAAVVALAYWGLQTGPGIWGGVMAIVVPGAAMALWGIFAVPGDRSRSGRAPVAVPGWVRLLLELALFGSAAFALYSTGAEMLALLLAGAVVVHYLTYWRRNLWLLRQ